MEKKTVKLRYPLTVDGAAVEELAMRRPLVRDMRAAQRAGDGRAGAEVALFANLCEIAPEAIDGMDLGDYHRLQGVYEGFLSRGSTSAEGESS